MQGEDLAARDVVARAVAAKYAEGDSVFLDARGVERAHFPGMFAACRLRGIDPAMQPIPVRPAAHYHMGGVAVNAECESSVEGLFAIGEAACTGLHGANRLASNSLLEAIVTGRIAAEACAGREMKKLDEPGPAQRETRREPLAPIRAICSGALGIRRDAAALSAAIARLEPHIARSDAALLVWAMAHAALQREESRGAHFRVDFPEPSLMAEPSVVALDALSGLELAA
jgi:L-aspartate oxidase